MKAKKEELISQDQDKANKHFLKKYSLFYDNILVEALLQNPVPMQTEIDKRKKKHGKTRALVDRLILRKEEYLQLFFDF
jgi:hypothetical protein